MSAASSSVPHVAMAVPWGRRSAGVGSSQLRVRALGGVGVVSSSLSDDGAGLEHQHIHPPRPTQHNQQASPLRHPLSPLVSSRGCWTAWASSTRGPSYRSVDPPAVSISIEACTHTSTHIINQPNPHTNSTQGLHTHLIVPSSSSSSPASSSAKLRAATSLQLQQHAAHDAPRIVSAEWLLAMLREGRLMYVPPMACRVCVWVWCRSMDSHHPFYAYDSDPRPFELRQPQAPSSTPPAPSASSPAPAPAAAPVPPPSLPSPSPSPFPAASTPAEQEQQQEQDGGGGTRRTKTAKAPRRRPAPRLHPPGKESARPQQPRPRRSRSRSSSRSSSSRRRPRPRAGPSGSARPRARPRPRPRPQQQAHVHK